MVLIGKLFKNAFQRTPYELCTVNSFHFIVKKRVISNYILISNNYLSIKYLSNITITLDIV